MRETSGPHSPESWATLPGVTWQKPPGTALLRMAGGWEAKSYMSPGVDSSRGCVQPARYWVVTAMIAPRTAPRWASSSTIPIRLVERSPAGELVDYWGDRNRRLRGGLPHIQLQQSSKFSIGDDRGPNRDGRSAI